MSFESSAGKIPEETIEPMSSEPLTKKKSDGAIENFRKLMQGDHKVFLFGAGTSKCAGLPLMRELTASVLNHHSLCTKTREILSEIKGKFEPAGENDENKTVSTNIEDYLSEMVDYLAIAERRERRGLGEASIIIKTTPYSMSQLNCAIEKIKQAIVTIIKGKYSSSESNEHGAHEDDLNKLVDHRKFVRAIHNSNRPSVSDKHQCVDYICLNYDTLLENTLALERISYADGLEGGAIGWWNNAIFLRPELQARIFKVHGSIDWYATNGSTFPTRLPLQPHETNESGKMRTLIWPASTKYRETQKDPYAQLSIRARDALSAHAKKQKLLVVSGYSFGDAHINFEIEHALQKANGNLTLVAFASEGQPEGVLHEWHNDSEFGSSVHTFAMRGYFHGKEKYEAGQDKDWWKFENLVKLLEGVSSFDIGDDQ